MARHGITTFGILFVIVLISQQCQLSFAQQCQISCSQTGFKGRLRYSRALEVAQNREHELDDDFGPDPSTLIYRSKRSDMVGKNLKNDYNLREHYCLSCYKVIRSGAAEQVKQVKQLLHRNSEILLQRNF